MEEDNKIDVELDWISSGGELAELVEFKRIGLIKTETMIRLTEDKKLNYYYIDLKYRSEI